MSDESALRGVRVLDLTNLLAAPQVAATLGDFGAEVVKIEPREGDPLRRMGIQREGHSPQWALVARNKRAITLDLNREEGRAILLDLVDRADVLIENLPAKLLARWGCDYETLAKRNPRLIVVSISCYGRSGPYADRAGAGTLAEAFGGFANMNGESDGPPMVPSLPLGDTLVGLSGVIGTMMALYARDRLGRADGASAGSVRGQHVDVSMVEPIMQLMALPLVNRSREAGADQPKRMGSRVAGGVPRNLYRARDGNYLALSGTTDAQVARILTLIGRDTARDRERFGTSAARLAVADELDGLVAAFILERSQGEALEAFHAIRIPVAPVNDLAALLDDPHVRARASVTTVQDAAMGDLDFVTPAPRLSETPGSVRETGPSLGEHNLEVYREWLGFDRTQVDALRRDEVI